jgi:hypothetical protein
MLSYLISSLPPSSAILGVATIGYVVAALVARSRHISPADAAP